MANVVRRELQVLEVDLEHAREALLAVVHTILFNRAIGNVRPADRACKAFASVRYATLGLAEVDQAVDKGIERFLDSLQLVGPDLLQGELQVSFFELRKKTTFLGFASAGAGEERIVWETWSLPVMVNTGSLQAVSAEATLRANLLRVLQLANQLHHVPKLRATELPVYRFDLAAAASASGGGRSNRSLRRDRSGAAAKGEGFLNQILSKGPPISFNL